MIVAEQFDLFPDEDGPDPRSERDEAMDRVSKNAGEAFNENARRFVLEYLSKHRQASGEDITDACLAAGIRPHDARAFGPVYMALSGRKLIVKTGTCPRRKGHLTAGGIVWAINETPLWRFK